MVALPAVRASNARISTDLPSGMVALFAGGTNGIGRATLLSFAKYAKNTRIYNIGRSLSASQEIEEQIRQLNDAEKGEEGIEYIFIQKDTSLIKNVDEVCKLIKEKEKRINLLCLSTGTLDFSSETPEGLLRAGSLISNSRVRFILNLLPLVSQAEGLRRIVHVFAGTKEGPLDLNDLSGRSVSLRAARGHAASLVTLSCEAISQLPDGRNVSFVHSFPGPVKTEIAREAKGALMAVMKGVFWLLGPFVNMDLEECGERHLFLATSRRYGRGADLNAEDEGVALSDGIELARGTNGKSGSGVYCTDAQSESQSRQIEELLAGMRKDGLPNKVLEYVRSDNQRITGVDFV